MQVQSTDLGARGRRSFAPVQMIGCGQKPLNLPRPAPHGPKCPMFSAEALGCSSSRAARNPRWAAAARQRSPSWAAGGGAVDHLHRCKSSTGGRPEHCTSDGPAAAPPTALRRGLRGRTLSAGVHFGRLHGGATVLSKRLAPVCSPSEASIRAESGETARRSGLPAAPRRPPGPHRLRGPARRREDLHLRLPPGLRPAPQPGALTGARTAAGAPTEAQVNGRPLLDRHLPPAREGVSRCNSMRTACILARSTAGKSRSTAVELGDRRGLLRGSSPSLKRPPTAVGVSETQKYPNADGSRAGRTPRPPPCRRRSPL